MDVLQLQQKLDELLAWRKLELFQARSLAENAENDEARKYLCRVWVLIMYAHCDNFLKEASKQYIEFVRSNPSIIYRHELMWLVIKGKDAITDGTQNNYKSITDYSDEDRQTFFDVILSPQIFDKRSFKYKSLRFFCDWVLQIDFQHQEFSNFCDALEKKRNSIAHGEESYIENIEDCLPWHKDTIKFIDSLKELLLDNASNA